MSKNKNKIKLEKLLKKGCLCTVDDYIAKYGIGKLYDDRCFPFYLFFTDYLNHDFVYNIKNPFLIVKVLVENCYEALEDKFINCRYINTMPKEYLVNVLAILNNHSNSCFKFQKYIISLFDEERVYDLIGYCLKNKVDLTTDISRALANHLIALQNIDLINEVGTLNNPHIDLIINREIKNKFPYDDLVKYFKYYNNDYEDGTISILLDSSEEEKIEKNEVLEDNVTIIASKLRSLDNVKINKFGRFNSVIYDFISDINNALKMNELDELDLNYLAQEIEKTGNFLLIENWVLNTSCSYNYTLVDALIDFDYRKIISVIFDAQDKSYKNYLVEKIFKDEYLSLLNYILDSFTKDEKGDLVIATKYGDIKNLDYLLKTMYEKNPEFKIEDKDTIYALVTNGSSYTMKLLQEVDFTKEERIKIVKSWKEKKLFDFYIIYGSYILNGLNGLTVNESAIAENREMLLSLRK